MPPSLKALPKMNSMTDSAYASLGGIARDAAIAELLEQFWPECYTSEFSGAVIMAPADAQRLEALYAMFGVPLKVSENGLGILGRAYDVFVMGLGTFVSHKLRFPTTFGECQSFREYLQDWPEDWVAYIEAVAAQDASETRRLAVKLQVLSPDCVYPPGTYIGKSPAKT